MLILLHDARILIHTDVNVYLFVYIKRNVFWDPAFHSILQGFNLLEDSNEVEFSYVPTLSLISHWQEFSFIETHYLPAMIFLQLFLMRKFQLIFKITITCY